jgi:hypothetical protein
MRTIILPANSLHRWLLERVLPVIPLLLACFELSPTAQGVSPAPDGGYPGGNTAEGQNALLSIITGTYDTAIGVFSLESNTSGAFNTAIGAGTLLSNIADSNTAIGAGALLLNTIGTQNTATGIDALVYNASGGQNTANGAFALFSNTSGSGNIALGYNAGHDLITGNQNIILGAYAGAGLTTGSNNIVIGSESLPADFGTIRIGDFINNTATFIAGINGVTITAPISLVVVNGDGQLGSVDIATLDGGLPGNNTAEGDGALINLTTGLDNTAMGFNALFTNTTSNDNTAIGYEALYNNTNFPSGGYGNTAIGFQALLNNISGPVNTALGNGAGLNATTGSNNVYIGANMAGVAGESNACYIASIFGQTSVSGIPVLINSSNKLGTTTSSKRFKEDIKPMDKASETLFALKPVSFRYKKEIDPVGISQLGLVAEDVEKVNPDLVVRDTEGKPYTVRYDQVNAMLLNEFLKEHREVHELKKQLAALTAGLQKVSAQLELSKSAPRTVLNNQ